MNPPEPTTPASEPHGPQPLGPDDFDAMDAALDGMREHDDAVPDWEYCEGFVTACICTRRTITPDECLQAIFGEQFQPMAHMEFVWRFKRRWQEIEAALDRDVDDLSDEQALLPELGDALAAYLSLPEDEREGIDPAELPPYGSYWAMGLLDAIDAFAADWVLPRDKEVAAIVQESIAMVNQLLRADPDPKTISLYEDGPITVSERRADLFSAAIWAVYDLHRVWKSLGERADPVRRDPAAPGRNDPCPCGSGKKFKKCHGA